MAKITRETITCERWEVRIDENCPICGLADPIPGPETTTPAGWANLPEVRGQHIAAFREMLRRTFTPPTNLAGDGIVYCGEGKYWPGIVIGVKLLRELGCTLPVQIWHNGPVGGELADDHNARLIDARTFRQSHPARVLRGWEIKTYAILHSGFRRVLFLDADAYAVDDPSPLFGLLENSPFVFWQDLHCCAANVHPQAFGLTAEAVASIPPVQGGQLLIDVRAFWREAMIAHWLCQHSEYSFRHGFGDQDQWRVVLAATGQKFTCLGPAGWQRVAFVCRRAGGVPAVVHRCRSKLYPGTVPRRWGGLPMERRVFEMFGQLQPEYDRRRRVESSAENPAGRDAGALRRRRQRVLAGR